MQLARHVLPGSRRSLRACCAVFGIDLTDAHRASADARATATLLECYIASSRDRGWWDLRLDRAAATPWAPFPAEAAAAEPWMPRERARAAAGLPVSTPFLRIPSFA